MHLKYSATGNQHKILYTEHITNKKMLKNID